MTEKTENTSFGNIDENTNDEPENQTNIEQKAVLQKYLNALTISSYSEEVINEFNRLVELDYTLEALDAIMYTKFSVTGYMDQSALIDANMGNQFESERQYPVYDENGQPTGTYKDFEGYFTNFPITGILANSNSEQEVIEFQRYLEAKGIVDEGYFNDSIGQYNNKLLEVVYDIMDYGDSNLNIFPGSPEYKALEAENDVRFFMAQENDPQYAMERKFFNKAIDAYAEQTSYLEREEKKQTREKIEGDLFQQALEEYPSDEEFKTIFENALADSGKRVTPKMLDKAATAFGKAYSKEMMDNADLIANFKTSDIYADYVEGTNIKREDVQMGGYMPTERRLNTDFFKDGITAEGFAEDYVEEEYGKEMDAVTLGNKKIETQQALLSEVFRYISP
jgi:hypothetical protein